MNTMRLKKSSSNQDYRSMSVNGNQAKCACLFKLVTNRSICLSFILSLCVVSLVVSLLQCSHYTNFSKLYKSDRTIHSAKISSKHLLSIRNVKDIVKKNEKDPVLTSLNNFNVKQQGMLTLKNMGASRTLQFNSATNVKNNFKGNNSVLSKNGKYRINEAENSVPLSYNKNVSIDLSGKKVSNLSFEESIASVLKTINNSVKTSVQKSNTQHQQAGLQNLDFTETGVKHSYEDYGDIMGKQSRKHTVEVDPFRQSFLKNVSKYITAIMQGRKHLNYYSMPIKLIPKQSKGVIILTNYRSGSTFLGQLFNQHPDAFYTFEPLFPFTGGCNVQDSYMAKILHQTLNCDFPNMIDVYSKVKGALRKHAIDIECLLDNFCFRRKTKELCDKTLCPYGKQLTCRKCGPLNLQLVKNVCRSKKVSVVKVIRMCDIDYLKSIAADPSLDLKIIHLVRDPRGIQSSRSKIHKQWDIKSNSESTCNRLLHNGISGNGNTSDTKWLKGRYMRVRYEDLSLDPINMAEKVYKFTGLDFVPEMKSWINSNTRKPSSKSSNKVNPYSTKRDSASTMEAWRKHLNLSQVFEVQSVCKETMKLFGYVNVTSKAQLENFKIRLIK